MLIGVRWHGSPLTISLMMLCITAPTLLLGPVCGVIGDKFNRTMIMMVSNTCMAASVAVIPLLAKRWEVFLLLVIIGSFESLFSPAEAGKLREIVADDQLERAIPINSSISQIAKVAGPGLSGLLVGAMGPNIGFYLDAASFLLSNGCLAFTGFRRHTAINSADGETSMEPMSSFREQMREGWKYIQNRRALWFGVLFLCVTLLILQLTDSQFVTLLRLVPSASANLFGYTMAGSGFGALVASLLLSRYTKGLTFLTMAFGTVSMGVAFGLEAVLVHVHAPWSLVPIVALFGGGGAGLVFIPFQTIAQRNTEEAYTSRVFGFIGSASTSAALVGPLLGGLLISLTGPVFGFLMTGLGLVMIGLILPLFRTWIEPRNAHVTESVTSV